MINIAKQLEYWTNSAVSDLETSEILIERNKILQGLFFCHLTIEKILKAHIIKATSTIPPKSHNLIFLSEKAEISVSSDDEIFFGILMKYQLQGRYPDYNPAIPDRQKAQYYLTKTKEIFRWLLTKL